MSQDRAFDIASEISPLDDYGGGFMPNSSPRMGSQSTPGGERVGTKPVPEFNCSYVLKESERAIGSPSDYKADSQCGAGPF